MIVLEYIKFANEFLGVLELDIKPNSILKNRLIGHFSPGGTIAQMIFSLFVFFG
jgi:hypothetical protein